MIGEIQFYKKPNEDYRDCFYRGNFYFAPIPYLLEGEVHLLRLSYVDKDNFSNNQFVVDKRKVIELTNQNLPDMSAIKYKPGEFSLINKHKYRAVIAITGPFPNLTDCDKSNGNLCLVIPLYSTHNNDGSCRHKQLFLNRVQAYQYPTLFFLPQSDEFSVHETLARLDRISVIKTDCLKPRPVSLSEDADFCLSRWLMFFLGDKLDEILENYRAAAEKALQHKP